MKKQAKKAGQDGEIWSRWPKGNCKSKNMNALDGPAINEDLSAQTAWVTARHFVLDKEWGNGIISIATN